MNKSILDSTISNINSLNKGILALDESVSSANKSLSKFDIEPSFENRNKYRQLFINTPNLGNYLSGIILSEEGVIQKDAFGNSFIDTLNSHSISVGVKLDLKAHEIPFLHQEYYTKGLDSLEDKAKKYFDLGVRFAKWRNVFKIDESSELPSDIAIESNAHNIALYASICQQNNIVPIIEPEVLMDGAHDISVDFEVTTKIHSKIFEVLEHYNVYLPGLILKMNMILPGKELEKENNSHEVANYTLKAIKTHVPSNIGAVVFLSGGQSSSQATDNLAMICSLKKDYQIKTNLTFSFLRAFEHPTFEVWEGLDANRKKAEIIFTSILEKNTKVLSAQY
jgi:fructose-bisphosphate aldolase class I